MAYSEILADRVREHLHSVSGLKIEEKKMFRGLARGRFPMLGSGDVFYHLTYIDDLVEGFRLCGEVPAAAGRTYLLAGPRYTTLTELVSLIAKELEVVV